MGIDFSHCNARWSYGGFNSFRQRLAKEIGMNLEEMDGFRRDEKPGIPFSNFSDDIIPLLDHSDCDGVLAPDECKRVAPRLRELISKWDDDDYDKRHALELADGMDAAAVANEYLEFT